MVAQSKFPVPSAWENTSGLDDHQHVFSDHQHLPNEQQHLASSGDFQDQTSRMQDQTLSKSSGREVPRTSLLGLPLELRTEIFKLAVYRSSEKMIRWRRPPRRVRYRLITTGSFGHYHDPSADRPRKLKRPAAIGLLAVNHQVRDESYVVLYGQHLRFFSPNDLGWFLRRTAATSHELITSITVSLEGRLHSHRDFALLESAEILATPGVIAARKLRSICLDYDLVDDWSRGLRRRPEPSHGKEAWRRDLLPPTSRAIFNAFQPLLTAIGDDRGAVDAGVEVLQIGRGVFCNGYDRPCKLSAEDIVELGGEIKEEIRALLKRAHERSEKGIQDVKPTYWPRTHSKKRQPLTNNG